MVSKLKIINYKICVFALGVIVAAIIYRQIDIDFSFYKVEYDVKSFRVLFFYYFFRDLKIWLFIYLLSRIKYKRIIQSLILAYIGYLTSAIIFISFMWKCTNLWNRLVLCFALWIYVNLLFEFRSSLKRHLGYGLIFFLSVLFQVLLKIIF